MWPLENCGVFFFIFKFLIDARSPEEKLSYKKIPPVRGKKFGLYYNSGIYYLVK